MRLLELTAAAALVLAAGAAPTSAEMAPVATPSDLKPFNITIRRFDLEKGLQSGVDFVLPVDSPDAEHACASTLANASAFSKKVDGGKPIPIAFTCTKIEKR